MTTRIKLRHDTASNWSSNNPVLALGEPGVETDTRKVKYGDGTTAWNSLGYAGGVSIGANGQLAIGNGTNADNNGTNSISIGTDAGLGQSSVAIAIGHQAGYSGQGGQAIAIGRSAGESNQDWNAIAIGRWAGKYDQQSETIAIGRYAARTNQRYHSIAIGAQAGENNQYWDAIAIGRNAGNDGQDHQTIAIGHRAGETSQQAQAIAIGTYTGNYSQGWHAIAIGAYAGNYEQGWASIAIGEEAGNNEQGFRGIAIGRWAGEQYQGQQAVAVGALAGRNNQGQYAVAVGRHAGHQNQGQYAVAVGQEAGQGYIGAIYVNQTAGDGADSTITVTANSDIKQGMKIYNNGYDNVAILAVDTVTASPDYKLTLASTPNNGSVTPGGQFLIQGQQGTSSVAIGAYAAQYAQHDNSIVINSTGSELVSAGPNTVVIKTVRTESSSLTGFNPVYHNPTTGELINTTLGTTWDPVSTTSSSFKEVDHLYFAFSGGGSFSISNTLGTDVDITLAGTMVTTNAGTGLAESHPVTSLGVVTLTASQGSIHYPVGGDFTKEGDTLVLHVKNRTNGRFYRMTAVCIAPGVSDTTVNIVIERLI